MDQTTSLLGRFLAPYRGAFRIEAFRNWIVFVAAWTLAPRKRTIAQICNTAAFAYETSHHNLYHLVERAQYLELDLDEIRLAQAIAQFASEGVVEVAIDDTLCHKRGAGVFGAGMQLDPVLSPKRHKVIRFGLNWLMLALVVAVPGRPDRAFSIPIAWRLCERKSSARPDRTPPKRTELARDLLVWLARRLPGREIRVLGDSAYLNRTIAKAPGTESLAFLGPMPMKAAIYALPAPRKPGQRGATRKKGDRLPSPKADFADWSNLPVQRMQLTVGGRVKVVEVLVRDDVLWYGTFGVRVGRAILVRDTSGGWKDTAFWTTDRTTPVLALLEGYVRRWSIEVLFRDSKQLMGLHDPQVRTETSVKRGHGQTWVVLAEVIRWYVSEGHELEKVQKSRPWYPDAPVPTISDMIETLRLALWQEALSQEVWKDLSPEKCLERLIHWISELH